MNRDVNTGQACTEAGHRVAPFYMGPALCKEERTSMNVIGNMALLAEHANGFNVFNPFL